MPGETKQDRSATEAVVNAAHDAVLSLRAQINTLNAQLETMNKALVEAENNYCAVLVRNRPPEPPEPPSNRMCMNYLSSKLIVPYPPVESGVDRTPYEMIAFWRDIWLYLDPSLTERIRLRSLCHLFNASLGNTPEDTKGLFTEFPHRNHTSLASLLSCCRELYEIDPTRAPTIIFIKEGVHEVEDYLDINYPLKIIGAGRDRTTVYGGGFCIQGTREEGKRVVLRGITMKGSSGCGLLNDNGLSFLCKDMTFTQCGGHGVGAQNTKGRLINCVITQCRGSGIFCLENALIELEGDQTKVDGNVTRGDSYTYGLYTFSTSSRIHLLFPLTQESVSTNNRGSGNYGGDGTIETVDTLESL